MQEDTMQRKAVVLVLQVWGYICSHGGQQESYRNFFKTSECGAWGKSSAAPETPRPFIPNFQIIDPSLGSNSICFSSSQKYLLGLLYLFFIIFLAPWLPSYPSCILTSPSPALLTDQGLRVRLQTWLYLANITQSHWGVSAPCCHVILV